MGQQAVKTQPRRETRTGSTTEAATGRIGYSTEDINALRSQLYGGTGYFLREDFGSPQKRQAMGKTQEQFDVEIDESGQEKEVAGSRRNVFLGESAGVENVSEEQVKAMVNLLKGRISDINNRTLRPGRSQTLTRV